MVEILLGLKQNQRNKTSSQQRFEKRPTDGGGSSNNSRHKTNIFATHFLLPG